jgi:hypothetical protein
MQSTGSCQSGSQRESIRIMKSFRTELVIPHSNIELDFTDGIAAFGSCFAENMGDKMNWFRFNCRANSHGIIFNPFSVAKALNDVIEHKSYDANDLIVRNGVFHSLNHHGCFSNENPEKVLQTIHHEIDHMHDQLKNAKLCLITFGTAWYYRFKESRMIVANCHKIPGSEFEKEMATSNEIIEVWKPLLEKLKQFNPNLQLVFTVSPVRHLRDGFHENQLSKANLLVAINQLINEDKDRYYFPAYEIMIDDLRDYRFCAEDMVHPSNEAVQYIWEKFSSWALNEKTTELLSKLTPLLKYLDHKPLKIGKAEHALHVEKKELEISKLIEGYKA